MHAHDGRAAARLLLACLQPLLDRGAHQLRHASPAGQAVAQETADHGVAEADHLVFGRIQALRELLAPLRRQRHTHLVDPAQSLGRLVLQRREPALRLLLAGHPPFGQALAACLLEHRLTLFVPASEPPFLEG